MATRDFSSYFLYRWRYVIGYALIGLLLATLLVFAGLYLPGGLSAAEITSVEQSTVLLFSNPETLAIPNLLYHAFQAMFFSIFGVSTFTIKLPSLVIALFSAVGLVYLLRRWFRPNISVLASLIAVTTGQFLFIAQSGTADVLYIFWPVTILLLGTLVTRATKHNFWWRFGFVLAIVASLYTPLSIYPVIAILLAVLFHPHLRAIIRRIPPVQMGITAGIFFMLAAPLFWLLSISPNLALELLGIPATWPPDLGANIALLMQQYFFFWKPTASEVMTPLFGLGSALLIGLGIYRLIRTRDTTRSYLIIFWVLLLIPIIIINPQFTSVMFVPAVFMLAAGLTSLIGYWYRLFPLNPYARVAGLIPIIVLVTALISTGFVRYLYGYHYNPDVVPLFSNDLKLLPNDTKQLVVSGDEKAFYEGISNYNDIIVVDNPTAETITVSREARDSVKGYEIQQVIVNDRSKEADRFYVLQRTQ